jgi:hypothetical protein
MSRLGYDRYVAQGGDWGAIITDLMGVQAPTGLLGIHSNMPGVLPPEIASLFAPLQAGPPPGGLSAEEQRCYEQVSYVYTKGIGYAIEMLLHPQTLTGSPTRRPGWRPGSWTTTPQATWTSPARSWTVLPSAT